MFWASAWDPHKPKKQTLNPTKSFIGSSLGPIIMARIIDSSEAKPGIFCRAMLSKKSRLIFGFARGLEIFLPLPLSAESLLTGKAQSGNTNLRVRLSTIDLLIKVACLLQSK